MCLLNAEHDCPDSYSYNPTTQVCDAHPICEAGAYREETQDCYEGENTCPYGETYTCKPYMGVNLCSPYACINVSDNETHTDNETETGVNDKEDDGLIDPGGNCLGTVYIYNGKDNRCRSWGATLYFAGCCNSDTYLMGTMDCNEDEKMLAMKKSKGLCHYVGEYDSRKMGDFTNIVTEKKKTYCCFNSKLSRIIQEQGRPQLIEFSQEGWGTPENPNCRGFNPEEFQMIDFTKVDMSEWAGDIKVRAIETIQSEIQTNIEAEALP
ncbi:MAG: conjugal transfer protein TraN [Proteobacteria bacterium]|nr:conjugal transfer protein TraN [Pseudomonadota bacterium]